ncbi:MAG: hypothetical protein JXB88_00545 [Spirochaetales bacterium]|nr:hypothetical protein [Spirochaetales bacterium]
MQPGRLIRKIGQYDAYLYLSFDIAVHEWDTTYCFVLDSESNRVVKYRYNTFTGNLILIKTWNIRKKKNGEIYFRAVISTGPDEPVYLADGNNHQVVKYTFDGQFVSRWGGETGGNYGTGAYGIKLYKKSGFRNTGEI